MGCIYSDFDGTCEMWNKDNPVGCMGCDEDGGCYCEEDPDPSNTCESYESDGNDDMEDEDDE